jgi:ubiquinol-cytochrome c reductase cytochrome c subunit
MSAATRPSLRSRIAAGALVLLVSAAATPLLAGSSSASSRASASPSAPHDAGSARSAAAPGQDPPPPGDQELIEEGEALYATGCVSCHGPEGEGVEDGEGGAQGPSLQESGEAAAYFYLSSGRMPLANNEEQPQRKEPAYDDDEIEALVAYVSSLGDGPRLPDLDVENADLAEGGEIYRANCQACHSASGAGGALSYGRAAPALGPATDAQVAAAVRVGPDQMPVFGADVIDGDDLDDLVAYVAYLDDPADPGGLPIGRTGPIPEGFVSWLVGMVALMLLVLWIGTRSPIRPRRRGGS